MKCIDTTVTALPDYQIISIQRHNHLAKSKLLTPVTIPELVYSLHLIPNQVMFRRVTIEAYPSQKYNSRSYHLIGMIVSIKI